MSAYSDTVMREPSLVGYWRLNDATGPDIKDSAGRYGMTGITEGTPEPLGFNALISNDEEAGSARITVAGQKIYIPDAEPLRLLEDMTIEMWAAVIVSPTGDVILASKSNESGIANPYKLVVTEGLKLLFEVGEGIETRNIESENSLELGLISHIVAVYDYLKWSLYLDSVEVASEIDPEFKRSDGGKLLQIGAKGIALSEVAVYNRAISGTTIEEHFKIGRNIIESPYVVGDGEY